jgi:hypothetical protein
MKVIGLTTVKFRVTAILGIIMRNMKKKNKGKRKTLTEDRQGCPARQGHQENGDLLEALLGHGGLQEAAARKEKKETRATQEQAWKSWVKSCKGAWPPRWTIPFR